MRVFCLQAAAFLGGSAVMAGAFGAHALRDRLSERMLAVFETGVRYQMYHALALMTLAVSAPLWQSGWTLAACWAWLAGVVLFSGSLYLLALTDLRILGAITPVGGVAFIVGWGCLFIAACRITSGSG
jgi:uncharacterized membrane protein YgdD (TMEM256/DUF423 family)